VVGSGWRAEFFLRLAGQLPDHFRATGLVTRSAERGAAITARWGVPCFPTVTELLSKTKQDVVIPCVPWPVTPEVTIELVEHNAKVLAETPPAPDADGLRALWDRVGATDRVQVAEQYMLMPGHAARAKAAAVIGEPTSVQVSSTHLYHAVSMIRSLLGVGFTPARVTAQHFTAGLADPINPQGWTDDLTPKQATTTIATIDFGGRMGLYDFTDNQWWNPLRGRRIVIRGSLGEIIDDRVVRVVDERTVVESHLVRNRAGTDLDLRGVDLEHISFDGKVLWRNEFFGARLSEDDIAVVDLLARTIAWSRDEGPPPYPLADGCQDHLISLAIEESARTGQPVTTTTENWMS
ncbi:MAG TPA: Gfo/Idh/MocA family oxidoreductase, partial [Pseudonocardiaceae bacterium]|nr:Gfo/Idh/MocA family oxidoreductase [Pseudonocardiaceae bacterium]